MVSTPELLLDRARRRTGLSDFGPDGWQAGFEHLVAAIPRDLGDDAAAIERIETIVVDRLVNRLRVEHWNNGLQQGRAAGRAMLDHPEPYDYVHSFWSDQYEHTIEYVGFAAEWDRLVFRGDPASRKFLGFYVKDGVVRAAVGLDRGGDPEDPKGESELKEAATLIRDRSRVDSARLAEDGAR